MRRLIRPLIRCTRAFRRDRRGVSAVEFALIAPVLIATYFGLAELSQGMIAQSRVSHAASAIGDLVAQDTNVTDPDMSDIFSAATVIVSPFPTAPLKMRVSSITGDAGGTPKVDWSEPWGSGMAGYSRGQTVTLPAGLITVQGDNVIMAETTYTYTSAVNFILKNGLNFNEKFYLRPRRSAVVTRNQPPA